jgi:hypothetical protein
MEQRRTVSLRLALRVFSQDSAATSRIPGKVYRVDLTTGHRELWKEIRPSDPAGVISMYRVLMTPDASAYAYSYTRVQSDLYLWWRA